MKDIKQTKRNLDILTESIDRGLIERGLEPIKRGNKTGSFVSPLPTHLRGKKRSEIEAHLNREKQLEEMKVKLMELGMTDKEAIARINNPL